MESHLYFLQAVGIPARVAKLLKERPVRALPDKALRTLVYLAKWVTKRPERVRPAHVAAVAAHWSPGEYFDAVGVILGFNFITRVANALGVELDMPRWARRVEVVRQFARSLVILALRWLVDLRRRPFRGRPAARNLADLGQLCEDISLPLPDAVRHFAAAPHLLEVQRALWEALLRRGGPPTVVSVDQVRFITVGLVVLDEIRAPYACHLAEWLGKYNPSGAPSDGVNRLVAKFALDVTRRSWTITPERIAELRAAGLDDGNVLDLVSAIALWNALGRLELLLPRRPVVNDAPPWNGPERCGRPRSTPGAVARAT
jgi:alkylhydroperoxidase family enzyme